MQLAGPEKDSEALVFQYYLFTPGIFPVHRERQHLPFILQAAGIPVVEQPGAVYPEIQLSIYISENNTELLVAVIINKINILMMIINEPYHIAIIHAPVGEETEVERQPETPIQAKRVVAVQYQ